MSQTDALPDSQAAAECADPSLLDRVARRALHGIMGRFDRSEVVLHETDGTRHTFGRHDPAMPAAHLHVHRASFYRRLLWQGEVGFGEAYVEGDWSSPDLPALLAAMIDNLMHIPGMSGSDSRSPAFQILDAVNRLAHRCRRNTRANSRRNIREHYDLSNEFYALWLDDTLTYSSALFAEGDSLEAAQARKYQNLCDRLRLAPGMQVLEIGCGWGGFALHAARATGAHVTAITISEAQFEKARARVAEAGLQHLVDIRLCDYRDMRGNFDAIVSIEMLEAVGHEFIKTFFAQCHALLKPTGRAGLQVIICPDSRYEAMRRSVDWIKKHIFPGGQLPSVKALIDSAHATGDLYLHHLETFGLHYARTLRIWRERFNRQRDAVLGLGFDEPFLRKWNYYLAYCEAAFATRNINVAQLVLTRPNNTAFASD